MSAYSKELIEIPMNQIIVSDFNVRKDLEAGTEDASLQDLTNNIKEKGLLNPITVRKKDALFEVIAGQRRFIACKNLGWVSILAFLMHNVSDLEVRLFSLIENVQRADLHPLDKGRAYKTLYDVFGTYTRVAKEVGVSNSTVKRYMNLLSLSPSIQSLLTTSDGSAGICRLSILAEVFPIYDEQEYVLSMIGGFPYKVQEKIIRKSEGDIAKIKQLVEQALLGCFSVEVCRGIDECPYIPDKFKIEIKQFLESQKSDIQPYFKEENPKRQKCVKCGVKGIYNKGTIEELGSKEFTFCDNLIGIPLDWFSEKYPQIREHYHDPMSYAIDLCEKCESLWSKGKIGISWNEIEENAYRFY